MKHFLLTATLSAIIGYLAGSYQNQAPNARMSPYTAQPKIQNDGGNGILKTNSPFGYTNAIDPIKSIDAELEKRIKSGYYTLNLDFQDRRAHMHEKAAKWSIDYRHKLIEKEYSPMFVKLGLSKSDRDKLEDLLAQIEKARCLAEAYNVQMDKAKEYFDQSIQQMLPAKSYKEFRSTETERPSLRRFETITNYLVRVAGVSISTSHTNAMLNAFKKHTTFPEPDGPYGRGMCAVGTTEGVLKSANMQLTRLQSEFAQVLADLPSTSDWREVRGGIQDFYSHLIGSKVRTIEMINGRLAPPMPGSKNSSDLEHKPIQLISSQTASSNTEPLEIKLNPLRSDQDE